VSFGIRTLSVCALSFFLALGIGLPARANPVGYLSLVTNAGFVTGQTAAPQAIDGVPGTATAGGFIQVNERIVPRANFLVDPGSATVLAIMPLLGLGAAQQAILNDLDPSTDEWVQVEWATVDGSPIFASINAQTSPTTFVALQFGDTPDAMVFARSVFVQFMANGAPVLGAGLPTMPPFFASTPASPIPLANLVGAVCGTQWSLCGALHGIPTQGNPFLAVDAVRLSFFVDHTPEPTVGMLLPMGLLALGMMRRRAAA
jgi:hypothetical protein